MGTPAFPWTVCAVKGTQKAGEVLGLGLDAVPVHGPRQAAHCGSVFPPQRPAWRTAAAQHGAQWFLRYLQTLYCRSNSISR